MRLSRVGSVISIAALMGLGASCTWITTPDYIEALDCLDLDGDQAKNGDCETENNSVKDCNDEPGSGGENESPLAEDERLNSDLWYDGFDNDCSWNGVGSEHDVLDFDGDTFPGITFDEWVANGFAKEWPANLSQDPTKLDCDDQNDQINPEKTDAPYDGIDSDCQGDDDFDSDGDGYIPGEYVSAYAGFAGEAWHQDLPGGDCDDSEADVNPGPDAATDEYYDGVDHDCSGNNDFDRDNDNYIPAEFENQCNAYNLKYGYAVACLVGDSSTPDGDCDEFNAAIHPFAIDPWYDNIDSNCDGRDDYDADDDGFIPDAYETIYTGPLPAGDCNDTDDTVKPGEMEIVADDYDQDCDGDIDTTTFAYGGYDYKVPRAPVIAANDHHFLVAIAADEITDPDNDVANDAGIALAFPFDAGFEPEPENDIFWQNLNTEPLAEAIDMLAEGDRFYVAFSYQKLQAGNNNNWLFIREHITSNDGANYSQVLVYSKQQTDPIYHDIDLRKDGADVFWVGACGDGNVHYLTGKVQGSPLKLQKRKDSMVEFPGGGGDSCFIEFQGASQGFLHTWGAAQGDLTYEMQEGPETIVEDSGSPWWSFPDLPNATTHDDWFVFAEGASGVTADDGSSSYTHLTAAKTETGTDYHVLDVDAIEHNGTLYMVAVTTDNDGDGRNDVVLAYGNKNNKLEDVVMPYEGFDTPQDPQGVSLYVTDDRIAIAVSSNAVTGTQDAVGWVFMGL